MKRPCRHLTNKPLTYILHIKLKGTEKSHEFPSLRLFFSSYANHRDLHVLTHSFPRRRSSDLRAIRDFQQWPAITHSDNPAQTQRGLAVGHDREPPMSASTAMSSKGQAIRVKKIEGDRKSTRLNSSH